MTAWGRLLGCGLGAMVLFGLPAASAQQAPPSTPAPAQATPEQILKVITDGYIAANLAERCGWAPPVAADATRALAAIREGELRLMVPPETYATIDYHIALAKSESGQMACTDAAGNPAPYAPNIAAAVNDQYVRMIAHLDVLSSYRWGRTMAFSEAEHAVLQAEIGKVKTAVGYAYYSVANPLETYADQTADLICGLKGWHDGSACRAPTPEIARLEPVVTVMYDQTQAFGKKLAAASAGQKADFLASIGGDIGAYSALNDTGACAPGDLVLRMDTATKLEDPEPDGTMTNLFVFADKYTLGQSTRSGWALLYQSYMPAFGPSKTYTLIAEDGGEWDEASARLGVGDIDAVPDDVVASWKLQGYTDPALIEELSEEYAFTYVDNFKMMGLMAVIGGTGQIPVATCTLD